MSLDRSVAVGIEVVGGHATVALVDRQGRISQRCQPKTLWGRPVTATLAPYMRAVDTVLSYAHDQRLHVVGIGISIPGSLDDTGRCPRIVPTLPALNGIPLCDLFEAQYHLPTHLCVDVDAAALGEQQFGAGKGFRRLLYLKVNAVVGASFVINGQPESSTQHALGHVCHLPVSTTGSGPRCSCGKRGCINTLVSLDALQRVVQRAIRRGDETSLTQRLLNKESFSPQLLSEEAQRGDIIALQVYNEASRWLGAAVTHYVTYFEPNVLVLGGDIVANSDVLLSRVRSALETRTVSRVCNMVEIMPACLGKDATLVGVAVPCF